MADSSQLIADSFYLLTAFLTTVIDSSLALWMTPFVLRHYDAFRSPLLVMCFPQIVILNGGKHALWEKRETGWWGWVKNLLHWWRLTAFLTTDTDPSHSFRMTFYGLLHHDSAPSSSLRVIPDRPPSLRTGAEKESSFYSFASFPQASILRPASLATSL